MINLFSSPLSEGLNCAYCCLSVSTVYLSALWLLCCTVYNIIRLLFSKVTVLIVIFCWLWSSNISIWVFKYFLFSWLRNKKKNWKKKKKQPVKLGNFICYNIYGIGLQCSSVSLSGEWQVGMVYRAFSYTSRVLVINHGCWQNTQKQAFGICSPHTGGVLGVGVLKVNLNLKKISVYFLFEKKKSIKSIESHSYLTGIATA